MSAKDFDLEPDEHRALADLARRLTRKLEIGKGMQVTSNDLALLAAIGVNDLIQSAAAAFLREQCQQRVVRKRTSDDGVCVSAAG